MSVLLGAPPKQPPRGKASFLTRSGSVSLVARQSEREPQACVLLMVTIVLTDAGPGIVKRFADDCKVSGEKVSLSMSLRAFIPNT